MGDIKTYNIGNIGEAQFFYQSADYQKLTKAIADKQEMVTLLQTAGKTERALEVGAELAELEQQLTQLKEDVIRLYETFTKIEIDTERLAKAKAHFDQGEFREADAILNAEAMAQDLTQLIERDAELDEQKATVANSRSQLSNEYLIKARLQATFYEQPNRFENACQYFEEALRAERTASGLFEYAMFLQNHNSFKQAQPLYEEALRIRRELAKENPRTYLPYVATTLNNLANLQSDRNDYAQAMDSYDEALRTYRELAKENPRTYLPDVAMTLVNLSIFYLQAKPDKAKSIALAHEVIEIAKGFPQVPIVQKYAEAAKQVLKAHDD
ncbi:MAG: tetratricopeptide repeat protein [Phormidesmis sp.]